MGKNNLVKKISVLGLAAVMAFTGLTLTGCSKALQEAQANIDQSVTEVLNVDESIQAQCDAQFENFTFLCADVEKGGSNQYAVDINGIASIQNSNQDAYTTLSYLVDGKYFDEMDKATHENIINALASIVQNEKFQSFSVSNINNVEKLNEAMSKVIESPLDDFHMSKNFLYAVGNVTLDEQNNVASFSTRDASKFYKTTTQTRYGLVGVDSKGNPKYGLVTTTKTDYETFFLNHNVYIQLTPEEMAIAKQDSSFIFDKFAELVKQEAKEKYVIQETHVQKDKEFAANMMDEVSLGQ